MHFFPVRNHIKVKRKIPSGRIFLVMPNWQPSDSYLRTHSDFRNAQKHCVDAFSRFSELLVDCYWGEAGMFWWCRTDFIPTPLRKIQ